MVLSGTLLELVYFHKYLGIAFMPNRSWSLQIGLIFSTSTTIYPLMSYLGFITHWFSTTKMSYLGFITHWFSTTNIAVLLSGYDLAFLAILYL